MAIVKNTLQNRYRTSGKFFHSYYPHVCDRCGTSLNAAALRRGHTKEDCDKVVEWFQQIPSLAIDVANIKTLRALDKALDKTLKAMVRSRSSFTVGRR